MRATRCLVIPALLVLGLGAAMPAARAEWPHDPLTNVPLCTADGSQGELAIVSDGAGGAIAAWQDYRSGGLDIYAQRVLASGEPDPAWPVNGLAVCTAGGSQQLPVVAADGAGGAIVAWFDYRNGNDDIYAQHVLASGEPDPSWPANGLAVCTTVGTQQLPVIAPDGAGGAVVVWNDYRSGGIDIYAQRVLASGVVDPAWPVNGLAVCTATATQRDAVAVSDGAGGAVLAWQDYRNGTYPDVYAQHVLASGAGDPAWPADGLAVCTAASVQTNQNLVPDGAGGAIVTWCDYRSDSYYNVCAQHVRATGAVDPAWPVNGLFLCPSTYSQTAPLPAPDGSGGAIVAWQDTRSGFAGDIYAQHVLASGVVDPAWPTDALALCTAVNPQFASAIVPDGGAGAIAIWADYRSGVGDIYAQHVLATGTVDGAWPADGRAVCIAAGAQQNPVAVTDGAGGIVAAWEDLRLSMYSDVYAQRVERFGRLGNPEPAIVTVADVLNDQGGRVAVEWTASYLDAAPSYEIAQYSIWRRVPTAVATAALEAGARLLTPDATTPAAADRLVRVLPQGDQTLYWEYVATQPARAFPGYSYLTTTTCDSLPESNPYTSFMVLAEMAGGIPYWASAPDSGYSVDGLAPATPQSFEGVYAAGVATLRWDANTEDDLAGYRLHRGHSESFVPDPDNLVAELAGTSYVDDAGAPCWYKLAAVDVHGNAGGYATLLPDGTVAVPGTGLPRELALAPPDPNPARGASALRFALPRDARVSLTVHDAAGRLVRRLVDGPVAAGERAVIWDGRDEAGAVVPGGLYFCRLEAEGRVLTARLAALR